jgi:hypothetical protein
LAGLRLPDHALDHCCSSQDPDLTNSFQWLSVLLVDEYIAILEFWLRKKVGLSRQGAVLIGDGLQSEYAKG